MEDDRAESKFLPFSNHGSPVLCNCAAGSGVRLVLWTITVTGFRGSKFPEGWGRSSKGGQH